MDLFKSCSRCLGDRIVVTDRDGSYLSCLMCDLPPRNRSKLRVRLETKKGGWYGQELLFSGTDHQQAEG